MPLPVSTSTASTSRIGSRRPLATWIASSVGGVTPASLVRSVSGTTSPAPDLGCPMGSGKKHRLTGEQYESELFRLQAELIKVQEWVRHEGHRVVIVFEGRDAAGKGGTIKRITQYLNPRV